MKKYDIDFSSTENLVPSLKYLAQEKKDFSLFKDFLKNNYKQIISNLLEKYYFYTFYDENGVVDERELNFYVEKSKIRKFKPKSLNIDYFSNKKAYINYFESECNLDELNSSTAIAFKCFPMHFFFIENDLFY